MVLDIVATDNKCISPNGLRVLEKRYLRRNGDNQLTETPEYLFRRVAKSIASAEQIYDSNIDLNAVEEEFFRVMANLEFLPNSPALLNAGSNCEQLSSCFVLPVPDSLEEIFNCLKTATAICKNGGGLGFNFSNIRPKGSPVNSRVGVAGGAAALINIFAQATDYIRQGGIRCGCNSVTLSIDHPDIFEFINLKKDPTVLNNFQNSISVTDNFMAHLKRGENYALRNPSTGEMAKSINSSDIFNLIVSQAWSSGDPGLVFLDQINRYNPVPDLGYLDTITGCGEQALLPFESSMLGSINLAKMISTDRTGPKIDYAKIRNLVPVAIRFLDNAIDINYFASSEIDLATKLTRKIGLGVMGFADMLIMLGIPYNSAAAVEAAKSIMKCINEVAHDTSHKLAKSRGTFPAWPLSIYKQREFIMRNASCTTIAPTGTLSIIAGVSSGIEPIFAPTFIRNILDGEKLLEINPYFEETTRKYGVYGKDLLEQLILGTKLSDIPNIPVDLQKIFVTAHQISPEWHVEIQSAFQQFTDNAVSKTVNFPNTATKEDISKVFIMAFERGLKGITVYRDQSRALQPLCSSELGLDLIRKRWAEEMESYS
ncbi:adenosylcobalamin-dependent ribonucleoside-diphosphate reductase [Dehalococcoides mccartyi]|uniref:adenosylcobalamin-dependent ribonucleoside-diphosphate reductase n=1 Tax=Dehalococcoides mccartyi TaxID=61435 RepID=UPI00059C103D|nr:adenosylcobalamin-dependent ribonucleoside-diphosphate reductase [Dehalococcoides mccartyi]